MMRCILIKVEYNKKGCFQCLYTDEKGALINNKANRLEEDAHNRLIIRNGCGGTRAPYGTAVLLRTVAAMLYCIENIFDVDDDDKICIYRRFIKTIYAKRRRIPKKL